ncbi:MAG TPA: glycosyltransferase [Candidatus Binataceae bacterium]|nr:glycosyltransferase [Candidatus Binataceae bacterium]
MIWRILTGEYPPQRGGVSDYTRLVARGLRAAGDQVHVIAPHTDKAAAIDDGIVVHRLPGSLGPRALWRIDQVLAQDSGRLLVQYVPQAFGTRGMNLPFAMWLRARRALRPIVMFHEVMFPLERGQPLRRNLLGAATRLMARLIAQSADRILVATPAWAEVLRERVGVRREVEWLPLPSVIEPFCDETAVRRLRDRFTRPGDLLVAHFSTYPEQTRELLRALVPRLLTDDLRAHLLLLGYGNREFLDQLGPCRERFAGRLHAPGALTERDLSLHLSAADLMLQPYPDGANARRSTLIIALAHRRCVLTTRGVATEGFWNESGAVMIVEPAELYSALASLGGDAALRARYADRAAALYHDQFQLRWTIARLRGEGCESH